ncbi:RteC domain-containing protein [Panacibacter ginsenosidivorans]|uniref:RteC domain-containing protein n=1 Tax=Panacibacter ginsenosidivorans TaxID=1813871 RepID=UPI00131578A2
MKDIAQLLEAVFGIDLGNYYRTFQEIRIRKSGRTNYLDQLKATLIRYMDETDLEYGK